MKEDYEGQPWFTRLNPDEKKRVRELRVAQMEQNERDGITDIDKSGELHHYVCHKHLRITVKDGRGNQAPTYKREFVNDDFSSALPDSQRLEVAVGAAKDF